MSTFKSKYGFHPCDYQTFRKLKAIHKWYWKALRDIADWERWSRKLPKNRVIRRWIRDKYGRKIGFEIVGSKPEPKCCPFFARHNHEWIEDYQIARRPRPKDDVKPLHHTVDQIEQMYLRCSNWYCSKESAA